MDIETPEGTMLYVFGSALRSRTPQDLDVLVVYDPMHVVPAAIYERIQPTFSQLQERSQLRVHPTVLTVTEAAESSFVERFGCIAIASWTKRTGDNEPFP